MRPKRGWLFNAKIGEKICSEVFLNLIKAISVDACEIFKDKIP